MWLAFVDGESAYCRPPPAMILRGLRDAGIGGADWLAIRSWLGQLRASVRIGEREEGDWLVECGVPQGGALS